MDASQIIDACGGTSAVARATGAPANTVIYWRRRGSIPAARWPALMQLARANKVRAVTLEVLLAHRTRPDLAAEVAA